MSSIMAGRDPDAPSHIAGPKKDEVLFLPRSSAAVGKEKEKRKRFSHFYVLIPLSCVAILMLFGDARMLQPEHSLDFGSEEVTTHTHTHTHTVPTYYEEDHAQQNRTEQNKQQLHQDESSHEKHVDLYTNNNTVQKNLPPAAINNQTVTLHSSSLPEKPRACQNYTEYGKRRTGVVSSFGNDSISNATMEFVKLAIPQHEMQVTYRNVVAPEILLNISRQFEPTIVGEEFLHLNGDVDGPSTTMQHLELLGQKLASKEAIKVVWMGGSNTHGRSIHPFTKQVGEAVNALYPLSSPGQQRHKFINLGFGGKTSCSFATSFKSELIYEDVEGADLIFLEFAANDGALAQEDRQKCLESLILRIYAVSPNATLVALCLRDTEGHDTVIRHYNLHRIYFGVIRDKVPAIRGDRSHLNDVGSFLVRQTVTVLLQEAVRRFCTSSTGFGGEASNNDENDTYPNSLPPRLFEPAENFDFVFRFEQRGKGKVIPHTQDLQAVCAPALAAAGPETNSTGIVPVDDAVKCSSAIIARMRTPIADEDVKEIPCDGCSKPTRDVKNVGGGWISCWNDWVCKPGGVHHHHCSSSTINNSSNGTGIFMQSFLVDNRATNDWPAHQSREIRVTLRLLKGYDADFGQALVMVWAHEEETDEPAAGKSMVTLVDTKWETLATVLADVKIIPSFPIPPPNERDKVALTVVVWPLGLLGSRRKEGLSNITSPTTTDSRCRLYFNSVLVELV